MSKIFMKRQHQRALDQSRPISMETGFNQYAEGSVLITYGHTKVLCNASIIESKPRFLRDDTRGWITAEYSMLPRATHERGDRESVKGKQSPRSIEIQRLIGRVLRNCFDLTKMSDFTIHIDCDVLQADGGTRTASINGALVATILALRQKQYKKQLTKDPLQHMITAFSFGVKNGHVLLDLDYKEDSSTDVDCNMVLSASGGIVEIQSTGEKQPLDPEQLMTMINMAKQSQPQLLEIMQNALA